MHPAGVSRRNAQGQLLRVPTAHDAAHLPQLQVGNAARKDAALAVDERKQCGIDGPARHRAVGLAMGRVPETLTVNVWDLE